MLRWSLGEMGQLAMVGLVLVMSCQAARSSEAKPTLEEKRLGVIRGTAPGIVIFDFAGTWNHCLVLY